MSDDDKTKKDEPETDAAEDTKEEPEAEVKEESDEKPVEEASADEPKAEEPTEEAAAPTANAAEPAGTDQQGRQLYNVKCSNCGKDTQVPFQPSGDRPVYCRDCYMQKKNAQG